VEPSVNAGFYHYLPATARVSIQDKVPVVGSCKHSNEPLDFIKDRELLDHLNNYQLLKKDFSPWN
jgi:hypothetical protein